MLYVFRDFVFPFYKKSNILGYFGKRLEQMNIKTNTTIFAYLEKHYGKRSRKLFKNNMEKSAGSSNRREALGNQIYATYPGR